MLNKPAAARKKFVFVTEDRTDTFRIISTAACEVVSVSVTGGSGSCTFRLVDANNFIPNSPAPTYDLESGPSFAAKSSESFSPNLNQPIPFRKGVVIVCEQGEGSNAECLVTVNGN